ncbi:MAG: PP2C family protein-serine/threonine phosphatase [Methylococcaceae bacterium]
MQSIASYYSLGKAGRPNEDRYRLLGGGFVLPDNRETAFKTSNRGEIYAVMDGVGGASKGMAAAQYIADKLAVFYTDTNIPSTMAGIESILSQANATIYSWGLMDGTQRPCGASTATLLWVNPDKQVYICHVGDSAAFLLTASGLVKATTNHEDARGIYRYVGQGEGFEPEIRRYPLGDGDTWCLVTDGITKGLKTHEIQSILEEYAGEPDLAAKKLVESAKRKGVQDDITAVVVEFE